MAARAPMTTRKKTLLVVALVAFFFVAYLVLGPSSSDANSVNLEVLRSIPFAPVPTGPRPVLQVPVSTGGVDPKLRFATLITVVSMGSKPEGSQLQFFELSASAPIECLKKAAEASKTPYVLVSLSGDFDPTTVSSHVNLAETHSGLFAAIGLGAQDDLQFVNENGVLWIVKHNKLSQTSPDCIVTDLLETDFIIRTEVLQELLQSVTATDTLLELFYKLHIDRRPVLNCVLNRAEGEDDEPAKVPFAPYGLVNWKFQAENGLIDVIDERTDKWNRIHGQGPLTYCNTTFSKHWNETHWDRVKTGVLHDPRATLWDWKLTLDELGLPLKISSGTLLGWTRQCDFIPYTSDLDTTMPIWMYTPELEVVAKKHNFKLLRTFGNHSLDDETNGYEYTFEHIPTKNSLDVFWIYHDMDGKEWTSLWVRPKELHRIYFAPGILVQSKWADFQGIRVAIPNDPVEYLYSSYGAEWMEPKSKWTWWNSVSNQFKPPHPRWPQVNNITVHPLVTQHRAEKIQLLREENINKGYMTRN